MPKESLENGHCVQYVHTKIRIISARPAEAHERKQYEVQR
jgi:uncharacterized DUF497 family protein